MLASVPGLPHERLHYCSGRRTLRRPRREVDAWWCGIFTCAGTTQVSDDFTDDSCVSEIGANTTHQSCYTRSSVVPACAKYHTTSLPGGVTLCTCGYHMPGTIQEYFGYAGISEYSRNDLESVALKLCGCGHAKNNGGFFQTS